MKELIEMKKFQDASLFDEFLFSLDH